MRIKACIFDLGGTIVDKYSLSTFISLKNAFETHFINIPNQLIYKDMGKDKKQHIADILYNDEVFNKWNKLYGNKRLIQDIQVIYDEFKKTQDKQSKAIEIIPETYNCFQYLKYNNIKIGCNTGFNYETMINIKTLLRKNNLELDSYVSSTCVNSSRPSSDMIYKNMINLDIKNSKSLIKIDDTNVGIQEGKNANCYTVGVARWSSYMKILPTEINHLNSEIINDRIEKSRKILEESRPDFIINTLNELPNIINEINNY